MNGIPSSTYFSAPPEWGWLIALYFFFGGLTGGSYFLASLIDLFGRPEDRPLSRLGYYIAFPCNVISVLLLIGDLRRPERFWHMLIESHTYRPMFKYWSPMSSGSWALLIFGVFAFVSFLGALADAKRIPWPAWRKVHPPSLLGRFIAVIGGIFGFYVAGYTGVLLAVTNRPIWSDTPLLGLLFIVSAASTSAALMLLLARGSHLTTPGIFSLRRLDAWVLMLEVIVLVAVVLSLGPVLRVWMNAWGLVLVLGVLVLGMLLPLMLHRRKNWLGGLNMPMAAALVLVGGFLLRLVIVFSAQGV
jgi:formate-dependent nitrite reductase membrane component NrfD